MLQTIIAPYDRVYIIIDALDECCDEENLHERLITEIENIRYVFQSEDRLLEPKVKLMVTSRHLESIATLFKFEPPQLEIGADSDDLSQFIHGFINRSGRLSRHSKKDPTLIRRITESVVTNSDKMLVLEHRKV
jgi:hypothetical protein